jgi:hypothetical protein
MDTEEKDMSVYVSRHGDIWFETGSYTRRLCGPSDMLAVAYEDNPDASWMMKHGEHARVAAWADTQRAKLAAAGDFGTEMASRIVVVAFPPVPGAIEILNWGLDRAGAIKTVIERIAALPEASLPPPARVPR